MDLPNGDSEQPSSNAVTIRRRKKKSIVWEYFTVKSVGSGCARAYCNQCKKSFAYITGTKLAGTSHLKRHIALNICPVIRQNMENKQASPYTQNAISGDVATSNVPRKRCRANPGPMSMPFNQNRSNHELAKMVILQNLPLDFGEQPGFMDFIRTIQPQFSMVRRDTIEADCLGIYSREKQGLLNLLNKIPGRVSLTVDLWTSDQTIGHAIVTGHFIDLDWKLNRRVLNVVKIPFPNTEMSCGLAIATCLTDWNLDGKLFTITFDKSFADDVVREYLRGVLSIQNPSILNGQLLIGNCYSRALSQLAQEALGSMENIVFKIRETLKYVESSEAVKQKFMDLRRQLRVPSMKSITLDDVSKWDTTYNMLVTAFGLKNVFSCMRSSDPNYVETPSVDEWNQVETLCRYLKVLFDAINILKATSYPTTDIFFHELCKIQSELANASMSKDAYIRNLISPLKEIFDRYWNDTSLVFAIAVVMDPRYKMKLVEFSFTRIYGENAYMWVKNVDEGVHELFLEYIVQSLPAPTFFHEGNDIVAKTEMLDEESFLPDCCDDLSDFDVYISELSSTQQVKSELDQYLEESLLPRGQDFDVLGWWKGNRLNYPTLSRMAADILMIPVSTFGPDSVFNRVSNKMDSYRTSLRPTTLESLICAKDWLQYGSSVFSNPVVKVEY